ncbi:hypothetical protein [Glycomyces harbinensis]|uniref:Uncharacterized protein n=1 Tax=Glycomyces harbinensis TaxID=58114 RepID=A0A1G6SMF5_9ACTN|nr:hypothetical protein [Glycomyces harbinensis]SDD18028.1 hypothetical protein SAMN05216270_102181 [Glycomyces harbinensis]
MATDFPSAAKVRKDAPTRARRILAVAALLAAGACLPSDRSADEDRDLSEMLGDDRPCAWLDVADASDTVFGDGPAVDWSEQSDERHLACDGRLSLIEGDDEVGTIDFTVRVFDADEPAPEGAGASYDRLDGFRPAGQEDLNEILTPQVDPIATDWDEGETYELEGLFRNRELYIVGAWGEHSDVAVGVSFRFTAEQEYYDQPLTYHEYCETTDVASGCLIDADDLYAWMTDEYLPAILDRLQAVSSS